MAEVIVGIDLGTSNCVVAHRDASGQVKTLADDAGYKIHPSVVSFLPNGTVAIGAEAKQRKIIDPQNTIYSAKRLIGRSFRSPEVQQAKARVPYQIREGANQLPLVVTRGGEFAIPEISAILLDHVRGIAAKALDAEVNQAVITVPANFNDAQRTATATAGAIAGLTVVRVLNEPTAAALAHGHARQLHQTIAVYDFGGGTFDVTILRLEDQVYEVLGTAGDSFLGGDDLDERLVDKMVERFLAEQRIDLRSNEVAMMRLRAVAEQTKIELSRRTRAVVRIDEIAYGARGAPLNLQIEITRDEFVGLVGDIVQRTFPVCEQALKLAGLSVGGIDDIVLVGGTTKVPLVREQVSKFFGKAPRAEVLPEEAVALGAAWQADSLQQLLTRPPQRPSSRAFPATEETYNPSEATDVAVNVAANEGRAKRETAELGSRTRAFSERPMTRGQVIDRFEDKEPTGVAVARLESRPGSQTATATRTDARPPSETRPGPPTLPDPRPLTQTRQSMLAPDEEESTAARPPIEPDAAAFDEDTSDGAPLPVAPQPTLSSANPVSTGRRPAAAPPPPPGSRAARPSAPTMAAAAPVAGAAPIAGPTSGTLPAATAPLELVPPPRPSAPSLDAAPMPRLSRPRMRDSLPAIDPMPAAAAPPPQAPAGPGGLGGGGAGALANRYEPSAGDSLAPGSTARGMELPADPQVTARGMVPELAGLGGLAGFEPPPPLPSTTARGVAPPAPTMMIGTGLASASDDLDLPPPLPRAPALGVPPNTHGLDPRFAAPPHVGPQARTMIAQAEPTPDGHAVPPGLVLGPMPGLAPPPLTPELGGGELPLPRAGLHTPLPFVAPPPPPAFMPGAPPAPALGARGPGEYAPQLAAGHGPPPTPGAYPPAAGGFPPPGLAGPGAPTMLPGGPTPGFAPPPFAAPIIIDVTPAGLGIVTVAGYCEELIRRNSRVPTEVRKVFSTSRDGQDLVRILVHQGEARRIEGNVIIGELVLSELPRRPRGEVSIEVWFSIDASGILHVRARDVASGREQRASLTVIGTVPEGDIAASRDRMQSLRR